MNNNRVIQKMRGGIKLIRIYFVRFIAIFPCPRKVLNAVYVKLTPTQKASFHQEFAKIFKNSSFKGKNGNWNIVFANKNILMPLTSERFWLDWDIAVSIVGHDTNLIRTYEALISSSERPELFIGANYGTHSLLFLVHQVATISFEPNPACQCYFSEICELNHVTPNLESVALGEKKAHVELSYPTYDTWLGSTRPEIVKSLANSRELVTLTVEQKTLDDYLAQMSKHRTLIKIDTEGNELSVLQGAERTLRETSPHIIFESFPHLQRNDLFHFLDSRDYQICELPWYPGTKVQPLNLNQFLVCSSVNFIATPI